MEKLESKVRATLRKSGIKKKNRIVIALSGGKDSTVVAYLLKKFGYDVVGFHIDLKVGKYSEECLKKVQELCSNLKIDLVVYDMKKEMGSGMCYLRTAIQSSSGGKGLKNCAICGVMKKWILNREIRKLRRVKYIATGHNADDEAQTFLLNIFKGSPALSSNSGIITRNVKNKKFIPRIKPLFYVLEDDVLKFAKKMRLPFHSAKCPCAIDSYRIQVRNFLEKLPGKDKENLMKSFDSLYSRIEKTKSIEGVQFCEICGEPSRGKICKKCQLMKIK